MPIKVEWANDAQNAVYMGFNGDWTLEDYEMAVREVLALFDSVSEDVHLIIDVTGIHHLPSGLLSALRSTRRELRPNKGETIIVGMTPVIRSFLQLLYSLAMFRWKAIVADDLDSALAVVGDAQVISGR